MTINDARRPLSTAPRRRHYGWVGDPPRLPAPTHEVPSMLGFFDPLYLLLVAPGAGAHGPAAQALHSALGGRAAGVVGLALHGPAAAGLSQTRSHGAPIEIVAGG